MILIQQHLPLNGLQPLPQDQSRSVQSSPRQSECRDPSSRRPHLPSPMRRHLRPQLILSYSSCICHTEPDSNNQSISRPHRPLSVKFAPLNRRNPKKIGQIPGKKATGPTTVPVYHYNQTDLLIINTTLAGVAQSVERVALTTAKRSTSRSWVRAPPSAIPIYQAHQSSCSFAFWSGGFLGVAGGGCVCSGGSRSTRVAFVTFCDRPVQSVSFRGIRSSGCFVGSIEYRSNTVCMMKGCSDRSLGGGVD